MREASLEQLVPIFEVLATRLNDYRTAHNGYVPRSLFLPWLGIAGVYYCCDIIVWSPEEPGTFLLKKRGGAEINPAMEGKFQVVGSIGIYGQSAEQVLARSLREVFGERDDLVKKYQDRLKFLFTEIHPEPWRKCYCLTPVFGLELDSDGVASLDGTWQGFSNLDDSRIVAHQRETLQYLTSPEYRKGSFITLPGTPD
jgi:hypothetical protein